MLRKSCYTLQFLVMTFTDLLCPQNSFSPDILTTLSFVQKILFFHLLSCEHGLLEKLEKEEFEFEIVFWNKSLEM